MVRTDETAKDEARTPASPSASRRAYAAPTLRYLGTVYELTLSGTGSRQELGPFPKPATG